MSENTQQRMRAAAVAVAPLVLLIGFLYMPYIGDYTDKEAVADTIGDDPERMIWGSIIVVIGMGLVLLAAIVLRLVLARASDERWSFAALPLVVLGGVGLAGCMGSDASMGLVALAGGDLIAVRDAAEVWTDTAFVVSWIVFALGWLGFAVAVFRSEVLPQEQRWVVTVALVVLAVTGFVPFGWTVYITGVALIVGLWPFAYRVWQGTQAAGAMGMSPA